MTPPRLQPQGKASTPMIVIGGAVAASALVFFFYTRPHLESARLEQQKKEAAVQAALAQSGPSPQLTPGSTAPAPGGTLPPGSAPGSASPAVGGSNSGGGGSAGSAAPAMRAAGGEAGNSGGSSKAPAEGSAAGMTFAQPLDVGTQIAKAISSGDLKTAAQLMGATDAASTEAITGVLDKMTKGLGLTIGPSEKLQIMGQNGEATRLSIPLVKPGEKLSTLDLQIEVVRDPKTGWKVARVQLPKELEEAAKPAMAVTATIPAAAPGEEVRKGVPIFSVESNPDPLTVAHVFVQALLHQDYVGARKLTDETKVPNQRLAGLCIVFEEGAYHTKAGKPLVMSTAGGDAAWVIAQIQSEKLNQATEFGLELQRVDSTKPWRIVGLNLSDLLGSFAKGADKLGVPYTPIVGNPRGGESLALYFEYDKASLHPRAAKQLAIVAELLKADSRRKLRIAGHTDSKGTDDYNIRLSKARAQTVKEQLALLGVPASQIATEALGKADPISPNQKADGTDDPEGRSRNRRAEILLDF